MGTPPSRQGNLMTLRAASETWCTDDPQPVPASSESPTAASRQQPTVLKRVVRTSVVPTTREPP
eukprot:10009111-Alexandrium_andersonii.AAC.1